jgi:hypothetical protein
MIKRIIFHEIIEVKFNLIAGIISCFTEGNDMFAAILRTRLRVLCFRESARQAL